MEVEDEELEADDNSHSLVVSRTCVTVDRLVPAKSVIKVCISSFTYTSEAIRLLDIENKNISTAVCFVFHEYPISKTRYIPGEHCLHVS